MKALCLVVWKGANAADKKVARLAGWLVFGRADWWENFSVEKSDSSLVSKMDKHEVVMMDYS